MLIKNGWFTASRRNCIVRACVRTCLRFYSETMEHCVSCFEYRLYEYAEKVE